MITLIKDKIDRYSFVKVVLEEDPTIVGYYSMDELKGCVLTKNGTYDITISNRLGYSYTFKLKVEGSSKDKGTLPYVDVDEPIAYMYKEVTA